MTDDLKPCPFCSGEAELPDGPYGSPVHVYEAKCAACYVHGAPCDAKAEAREAWNRRPVEDALRARAEAAEAEVARLRTVIAKAVDDLPEWSAGALKYASPAEVMADEVRMMLRAATE